jgi:hypothetical protein
LLIPTALYVTNGPGVNTTSQAAEEPNYLGPFGIGFDVHPHNQRTMFPRTERTEVVNDDSELMMDLGLESFTTQRSSWSTWQAGRV